MQENNNLNTTEEVNSLIVNNTEELLSGSLEIYMTILKTGISFILILAVLLFLFKLALDMAKILLRENQVIAINNDYSIQIKGIEDKDTISKPVKERLYDWQGHMKGLFVEVDVRYLLDHWSSFKHIAKQYDRGIDKEEALFHLVLDDLEKLTENIDEYYDKVALGQVVNSYYLKITGKFINALEEIKKSIQLQDDLMYEELQNKHKQSLQGLEETINYLVKKV